MNWTWNKPRAPVRSQVERHFARLLLDSGGNLLADNSDARALCVRSRELDRLLHHLAYAASHARGDTVSARRLDSHGRTEEWQAASPVAGLVLAVGVTGGICASAMPAPHFHTIVVKAASLTILDGGADGIASLVSGGEPPRQFLQLFDPCDHAHIARAIAMIDAAHPSLGPWRLRTSLGGTHVVIDVTDILGGGRALMSMQFSTMS